MLTCTCARCGEPLTKPHFYKGRPYGYTCINFVDPTCKPRPSKETFCESSEFVIVDPSAGVTTVSVTLANGKKCNSTIVRYKSDGVEFYQSAMGAIKIIDNVAYVMLTNKDGKKIWKWQSKA